MSDNKNEALLALVSDLTRRRKRIMKRELNLPERKPGEHSGKKLFPPDILSQRAKSGPPMAKLRILTALSEIEKISQKRLAEILSIRPQSLTDIISKMEQDGLVTRKPNEADRRQMQVSITDSGREKISSYEAERSEYASAFFSPLSEDEKEQLILLLSKLLENEY